MSLIDTMRIEAAVLRYDFWLEGFDVYFGERRAMRRDLRANLTEAAAAEGTTAALDGLGSIRALARAQAGDRSDTPRWSRATWVASGSFAVLMLWSIFLGTAWWDGAEAAAPAGEVVTGRPALAPWIELTMTQGADGSVSGVSATLGLGWLLLAWLAIFLIVARPWRLLRRSPSTQMGRQA
ncbi:MAG: hypothetical protein KBB39_11555 [Phycicoccus sp.]|nr:hypothetical protein [Phycicoccus sp.]